MDWKTVPLAMIIIFIALPCLVSASADFGGGRVSGNKEIPAVEYLEEYRITGYHGYVDHIKSSEWVDFDFPEKGNFLQNHADAIKAAARALDYCNGSGLDYLPQRYNEETLAQAIMGKTSGKSKDSIFIKVPEEDFLDSVEEHGKASISSRFNVSFIDIKTGTYGESSSELLRIRIDDLSAHSSPEDAMKITKYVTGYGLYKTDKWGTIPYNELYPDIYNNIQEGNSVILLQYDNISDGSTVVSSGNGWYVTKEADYGLITLRIKNPEITSNENEVETMVLSIEGARGKSYDIFNREDLKDNIKGRGTSVLEYLKFFSENEYIPDEEMRLYNEAIVDSLVLEINI